MKTGLTRREFLKLSTTAAPWFLFQMSGAGRLARQLAASSRPSFLVLVFDTLSAKHLPIHGYARDTAPNFSRFAARATVFHEHYASGNFTSPGTASILTGVYPWTHRALYLFSTVEDRFASANLFSLLPPEYHTVAYTHNVLVATLLAQFRSGIDVWKQTRELSLSDSQFSDILFANDYSLSALAETRLTDWGTLDSASLFMSQFVSLMRLALRRNTNREYGHLFPEGTPRHLGLQFMLEDTIDWLGMSLPQLPKPYMAYVHVLPPHEPYLTRREFTDIFRDGMQPVEKPPHFDAGKLTQGDLNQQRRKYDEYLAYADAEFGRLLDSMEREGVLDDTFVVVTSDHGEMFERGIRGHVTKAMYEPIIRVPLLISAPGQTRQENVHTPTNNVDLLPTLLHLAGQAVPEWSEGRVLPLFGGEDGGSRPVFSVEAKRNPHWGPLAKSTIAVRQGAHKLIAYRGYDDQTTDVELYNVLTDPEELEELAASRPGKVAELLAAIDEAMPDSTGA